MSDAALRSLADRADSLWSRTHANQATDSFLSAPSDAESRRSAKRLEAWRSILKCDDIGGLDRRLTLEGLNCEAVIHILGGASLATRRTLPHWAKTLNLVLREPDRDLLQPAASQAEWEDNDTDESGVTRHLEPPFIDVFSGLAANALALLEERCGGAMLAGLAPTALIDLDAALRAQLSELCAFSLEYEFSLWRQALREPLRIGSTRHYRAFVEHMRRGGLTAFLDEYAVLARLVGIAIERWVDSIAEFLCRLEHDRAALAAIFHGDSPMGLARHLSVNLSDLHEHGRRVILAHFETGMSLAYKPRSIALDQAFYQLLRWLNEHAGLIRLYAPRLYSRESYGWVEFITREDCADEAGVRRYYHRSGMLLSLASILSGTDFHHGNIIARGEHPVLIDLESLFAVHLHGPEESERDASTLALLDVVRTGLLPNYQLGPRDHAFDVSGLGGQGGQPTGFSTPEWLNVNTDTMSLGRRVGTTSFHDNAPRLHGRVEQAAAYRDEIVRGYREMGAAICQHSRDLLHPRGPIAAFEGLRARLVFRPTSFYHLMLRGTLAPEFLRHGVDRSIQLDVLSRFLMRREGHEAFWPLLKVEMEAMEDGEVPFFYTHTNRRDILAMGEVVAGDLLEESACALVVSRIERFSPVVIDDQVAVIDWAFLHQRPEGSRVQPVATASEDGAPGTMIVHAAQAIGREVLEQALSISDGLCWFAPRFNEESNRQIISLTGDDLYAGAPGIGVFFAALARMGGDSFREAALRALQPSRRRLREWAKAGSISASAIGGALGNASTLYAWLLVGSLIEEMPLVDAAVTFARRIDPGGFPQDAPSDVIRGVAGTLLSLLAIHKRSGDSRVLERAKACGKFLLASREREGECERIWRSRHGQFLTGFAHGSTGIGFALLRLHEASGEPLFRDAALEAIAYESRGFDAAAKAWPDMRYGSDSVAKTYGNAWCHGAAGIGLFRLEALRHGHDPTWLTDVDAALTCLQNQNTDLDQLCCGHMGRSELLLQAGRQLKRPDLCARALKLALGMLQDAERRGKFCLGKNGGLPNPGLFLGTSGIGYQLLRIAAPDSLPSLLTWEVLA